MTPNTVTVATTGGSSRSGGSIADAIGEGLCTADHRALVLASIATRGTDEHCGARDLISSIVLEGSNIGEMTLRPVVGGHERRDERPPDRQRAGR